MPAYNLNTAFSKNYPVKPDFPLAIGDRAKTINRHTQAGVALAPSLS